MGRTYKYKPQRAGNILAIPIEHELYMFCKVIYVSEESHGGIHNIHIAIFSNTAKDDEMPKDLGGEYLANYWTFDASVQSWKIVGETEVSDEELLMTTFAKRGEVFVCEKPIGKEEPGVKYPRRGGLDAEGIIMFAKKAILNSKGD